MYRYIFLLILVFLTACSTEAESLVDTLDVQGVEQTPQSRDVQPPEYAQKTATFTATAYPTYTPRPPIDPIKEPAFDREPKSVPGGILDTISGYLFKFPEVTLLQVASHQSMGYEDAGVGNTLISTLLRVNNTGDSIADLGYTGFQVFDDNGVGHDPEYTSVDCRLESSVEVLPGGVLEGCLIFEIPNTGHFSLVYAPYKNNRFGEDRYLNWEITYDPVVGPYIFRPSVEIAGNSSYRPSVENVWAYFYGDRIVGEMQYTGPEAIEGLRIEMRIYDNQNRLIETLDVVCWMETILPGDKVVYWVYPEKGAWNVSQLELTIRAERSRLRDGMSIYRKFSMNEFYLQKTDRDSYEMIGSVGNMGGFEVYTLGIHVIAYDVFGNIVGYEVAVLDYDMGIFYPGMVSSIEGSMRIFHPAGYEVIDHFEYIYNSYSFDD